MTVISTNIYTQQRDRLIQLQKYFSNLLPEQCPEMPELHRLSQSDIYRILQKSANSHSSLQIVVGWGDGSIVQNILDDTILNQKHTIAIVLKGEEDAFAASMRYPLLNKVSHQNFHITYYKDNGSLNTFIANHFSQHHHIPPLAGCEIIDQHPLTIAAQETRQTISPPLYQCLADQPYQYGNDIYDSFIGLEHASANAKTLLPSPTIGEMKSYFGDRPIISIAAGPSLQNHIEQLKDLQDHCVLIACDAVLPGLIDAGIEPHFVTPLERVAQNAKFLAAAQGTRTIYAGLPVVPPFGVDYFDQRCISLYAGDRLYNWLYPHNDYYINTGTSTGVLS
ncbi:MAG: motility associated factor glycosyltransferase family protein, partial [Planctomycetes bacterium]|nr:motility associated factor glycosyltransferase family protein [Planctomycetota bacterium]